MSLQRTAKIRQNNRKERRRGENRKSFETGSTLPALLPV